jgi:phage terminase large subunit-like protein
MPRPGRPRNVEPSRTSADTNEARRARRIEMLGHGTVHEPPPGTVRTKAMRAEYDRVCTRYPVPAGRVPVLIELAGKNLALRKARKAASRAEGDDAKATAVALVAKIEADIARLDARLINSIVLPPVANHVGHNAIQAPEAARVILEAIPGARFARFHAVVAARGEQVPFDFSTGTRGEQVVAFVQSLKIPDGPTSGQPFTLEDWQIEDILEIYDASDDDDLMAVKQAIITIARKNGKTSLIAALLLAHLVGPLCGWNRQIYSAAFDREQASIIFRAARSMVAADAELSRIITIHPTPKLLSAPMILSTYHAISAEARSKHGMNPSLVIFDELAQFGADRELFDVLQTSMGAQTEALMIVISTQAANDEAILSQLIDYGRGEGALDPAFRLIEYSVPQDADPWDEANWYLANPALGTFRSLKEMREFASRAKAIPSAERTFRNLYLNQRVAEVGAFISPNVWDACNGIATAEEIDGAPCWIGIDLSQRLDLTAVVFLFEIQRDGVPMFAVRPVFFTPRDTLDERGKRDRVPYYDWSKTGQLVAVPGPAIDYRYMAEYIAPMIHELHVEAIAFDRWRFESFKRELVDAGVSLDDERFIGFGQGFKDMAPAVDVLEETMLNKRILHGGHPVLRWNAGNCALEKDAAGNRKFTKAKSYGRIDGIVALAMALAVAARGVSSEDGFDQFVCAPLVIGG